MEVVENERPTNIAFLGLPPSGNHHDPGPPGDGSATPARRRGSIRGYHLTYQVDTIDECAEVGAMTGESDHKATRSLHGANPDSNEFA